MNTRGTVAGLLAMAVPLWAGAAAPVEPGGQPGGEIEMHEHHPGTERVTFLGVEAMPASRAIGAQLGLPEHTGLVVADVAPDSPAASVFRKYDVLTKLDDQWLIDPFQFAVLVRQHHDGDEVSITYERGGKQEVARVRLAEHEVPKREERLEKWRHLREPGVDRSTQEQEIQGARQGEHGPEGNFGP